jgi:hypothetical protein
MKENDDTPLGMGFRGTPTADEIAELASQGEDVSGFFTGTGRKIPPVLPQAGKEKSDGQED